MIKKIKLWRMGRKAHKNYMNLPNNWKCLNCGYEGECRDLPAVFACPKCGSINLERILEDDN